MLRLLIFIIFPLFLYCCAVNPKSLKSPQALKTIDIKSDIENTEAVGLAKIKYHKIIKLGLYTSILEDNSGIYFEGPKGCILLEQIGGQAFYYNGGIWYPKAKNIKPKIYIYNGSQNGATNSKTNAGYAASDAANPSRSTPQGVVGGAIAGAIVTGLMDAEVGKIQFLPEINDEIFLRSINSYFTH